MLAGLAAFRRQTQQALVEDEALTKTASEPSQSSLMLASADAGAGESMMMAAAAANSAPTASPTVGLPETVNGVVAGSLNAVDTDGNPLTYAVQSRSAGADVKVDGAGNFTYTPSVVQRLQAVSTSGLDTDTFTVRVSDGQTFTDVPVTVVVRPAQLAGGTPVDVDRDPSGVAFNADGSRAYVTNKYDKTVSVVNTTTGGVVATIKVPYGPNAVVVSPVAGQNRAYVAMTTGVAVIDTATNKLVDVNPATTTVDSIKVGASPSALAINSTGTRLYVSNGGSSTVSVINTATNTEITKVTVGSQPSGLAVSPDDSRVYALSRYSDKVTVFSAATNQVIGSAAVGDSPRGIVLSPNGQVAYVTNYNSGTVTVLNTSANTPVFVKAITVGTQPEGIAITKDGSAVYVANGKDTLSVIDTRTNTVTGSAVAIDTPAESGAHAIAVSGNKIYVTDYVDDFVRVVNVSRVQTPPQSFEVPTQNAPDSATGTVTGDLKVVDTDGDALSYTVVTQPGKGALTVNANGVYTYTPTQAAREQAGPNAVDVFTVRVSDSLGASKDVTVTVPVLSTANHAPTAPEFQYFEATDPVTGEVRGRVIASDADGNPLSYQLLWGPSGASSFTFNSSTGDFTYIPSQEMREYVTLYPGYNDYDTFRVTISDGTASVSPWINMRVTPIEMAPTAYGPPPQVPSADPATGRISGAMNVYDPNGDPVTFSIRSAPARGTASVDSATGIYTYTPLASQRSAGGIDTFTVSATDGQQTSTFTVTVPVRPPELASSQTAISAGTTRLAVSATRAYALHLVYDGTLNWQVDAIDTATNSVVATSGPISVLDNTTPLYGDMAVSPDGTRLYVAPDPMKQQVIVLDTSTMRPVGNPIAVGTWPTVMAVSRDGSRLYVGEEVDGTVQVIDTATRTVTATIPLGSGSTYLTDMVVSPDGSRVYVADGYNNKVMVVDIASRTSTSITLGLPPAAGRTPGGIAVSPDGKWLYATNTHDGTVSVIDTTTKAVVGSPILVGVPLGSADTLLRPTAIAVSPDGKRIYVARSDDIVVIDAATRTVIGAVRVDPGGLGWADSTQSMAVEPDDGDIYIAVSGSGLKAVTVGQSPQQM
jgi:YVTN family beta-propeller protein/VCBS repeat-containing protein